MHLHLGSHSGTHLDAPSHVVGEGPTVDELPLHLLVGPAVLVDLRDLGPREPVEWERLAAYARPGRMLVLHTGWSRFWGSGAYEDHPYLSADAAEELVAAGVRTVGIDALSIDESGGKALPAHEALLGAGGVAVENLTDLAEVDHPEPVLSVLPLPLRGGDGSPVRAVALLPEQRAAAHRGQGLVAAALGRGGGRGAALDVVALHPWPWLRRPGTGSLRSFSAWRR